MHLQRCSRIATRTMPFKLSSDSCAGIPTYAWRIHSDRRRAASLFRIVRSMR